MQTLEEITQELDAAFRGVVNVKPISAGSYDRLRKAIRKAKLYLGGEKKRHSFKVIGDYLVSCSFCAGNTIINRNSHMRVSLERHPLGRVYHAKIYERLENSKRIVFSYTDTR